MRRIVAIAALGAALIAAAAAQDHVGPEARYLRDVRQVTSGFTAAGEGYFSPDGRTIIYQAIPQGYPFYQIYTQELDGGRPQLVSTGRGRTTCSYFHPRDPTRVIFASSHLDPNLDQTEREGRDAAANPRRRYEWVFDPHMDIWEKDLESGEMRRLTDLPGYDAEGSYSPDGAQIVFTSTRDGDPDLYIMDADGANVRQLTNAPGYDGGPFFSPDGHWVIFRSDRAREDMLQIYAIAADGTRERALTGNLDTVNWAPYWHPDGRHIIWCSADYSGFDPAAGGRPDPFHLYLMELDFRDDGIHPGEVTQVTYAPVSDVLPVFSPDGERLLWTSRRAEDGSSQLFLAEFVMEIDGRCEQ